MEMIDGKEVVEKVCQKCGRKFKTMYKVSRVCYDCDYKAREQERQDELVETMQKDDRAEFDEICLNGWPY